MRVTLHKRSSMAHYSFLPLFFYLALLQLYGGHGGAIACPLDKDPICGFISLPLNNSNFKIHKPYNLPESARYNVDADGVHKLWVLSTDMPFSPGSPTRPRTEIMILGHDYSSGVWQFEGHVYIPAGTTGVSVMQVFHATHRNTTLMLWVNNGALMYYGRQLIADEIYGKWIKINVIHDTGAGMLKVFVDGELKFTVGDDGGMNHYFKLGVYTQNFSSYFMESRWKGIKVLKKADGK